MATLLQDLPELDFSDFTTTTTTSSATEDHCGNWGNWSPVVDWDALLKPVQEFDKIDDEKNQASVSDLMIQENDDDQSDELKGLRLVHLLMAVAEAMTTGNKNHDLANVILVRLKDLVSATDGTNMERLAAYFTDALLKLLELGCCDALRNIYVHHNRSDILAAFQLFQDMSPYVKFGHFTANQAIVEVVSHERRVHIIDYDIMEGIQWASLMQALTSRKDGLPAPHLRITAVSRPGNGRRSVSTVQETGRRLIAFASSIGQPFSFHQCKLDANETLKPSGFKLVRGEAIVVNCMLHMSHFSHSSRASVASFLSGSKTLNPKMVTLVEEERLTMESGFLYGFMDTLHHYSALYDSLEAGFPMQVRARTLVERLFLGPRILGSLARVLPDEMVCGSWGDWLCDAGFQPMNISFANHCQAKLLLGLFNDGYRVEEPSGNKLVLCWKSRRLISASIWSCFDSN